MSYFEAMRSIVPTPGSSTCIFRQFASTHRIYGNAGMIISLNWRHMELRSTLNCRALEEINIFRKERFARGDFIIECPLECH
jgi:hypothetical protein